jgi:DNA-directed RNA polymerase subunit RPC12/RpoP
VTQAVDYKCPRCGGSLVFSAEAGVLVCPNCGSSFDPRQFDAQHQPALTPQPAPAGPAGTPQAAVDTPAKAAPSAMGAPPMGDQAATGAPAEDNGRTIDAPAGGPEPAAAGPPPAFKTYTRQNCGAVVVAEATAAAGACPYCRSPIVIAEQVAGELTPDLVIPFAMSRDQAVAGLEKLYRGKRLLPKVFARQNFVDEVKGVYVPFWLFDFEAEIFERFTATDVTSRYAGNRRYITTRRYRADRSGEAEFRGIPVDGSTNMPDAIMESIEPFGLTQAVPFQAAYLPGFLAERYDVGSDPASQRAHQRLTQSVGTLFQDTVTGHQTVAPDSSRVTVKRMRFFYALLPVWMLTTIWRGQRFTFAMNGQTGRMVGDLPLDRAAYWRWFAALGAASAAIAAAIAALAVTL